MKREMLGLLAKYPAEGLVKTRLAQTVGGERASEIYRVIAEAVFQRTRPAAGEYERVIFYDTVSGARCFEDWLPGERLMPQRGGDIGAVMANALDDLFAAGAERAVIAGVDIPGLEKRIVRNAFVMLGERDVVLGPALDGGYYLVGMSSLHNELFQKIPWSTEEVFAETVRVTERLGLTYGTVEPLSDVDRAEDLERFPDLFS